MDNSKPNCPNCGAPFTGLVCEYCGTTFDNVLQAGTGAPAKVVWTHGNVEYTMHVIFEGMSMSYDCDATSLYSYDGALNHIVCSSMKAGVVLEGSLIPVSGSGRTASYLSVRLLDQ